MFRTFPLPIIRSYSLYTQHWYIQFCRQVSIGIRGSYSKAVCKSLWHITVLCVRWETPGDGRRNCPKYVEFHSKIKFEKISASIWFHYKDYCSMFQWHAAFVPALFVLFSLSSLLRFIPLFSVYLCCVWFVVLSLQFAYALLRRALINSCKTEWNCDLRSLVILSGVWWKLLTDVSCPSVRNYNHTLRNISKGRRSRLLRGGSLSSWMELSYCYADVQLLT
jgi:hypothetical protein